MKLRWHPTSDVFLILTSPCGQATAIGNREDWTLDAYQCPFCHQPMEPDGLVLSDRAGSI